MPPELRCVAALLWRPAVGVWTLTLLILASGLVLRHGGRALVAKVGRRRGLLLATLRAGVLALLLAALLDPTCERRAQQADRRSVVIALDQTASMAVADRGDAAGARLVRARAVAEVIEKALPSPSRIQRFAVGARWQPIGAWSELQRAGSPADGTDLAAVLVQSADRPELQDAAAIVLLTDGGDSAIDPAQMPSAPLVIVGVGGDPQTWRDLSVRAVTAPERVEVGSRVRVDAVLMARTAGDAAFAARLAKAPVVLEREQGERWVALAERRVDWQGGTAQASFETVVEAAGTEQWRVRIPGVEGELSELNNARRFPIHVVRESLKVLYFTRRLGADLKFLRQELSTDESVSFNTLVQAAGDRFLLQGDAASWSELAGVAGLPPLAALKRFNVVVVGSFPATEWRLEEIESLRQFVTDGGGLVWVGGEHSFDAAYAASPLAELIPWRIGMDDRFVRTTAGVSPTAEGTGAAATAGLWDAWRDASSANPQATPEVQSIHTSGPLKAGAVALLSARTPEGVVPLLVEQPYGRGRLFALASNTTWRWVTAGPPLDRLYRRFWRQLVRAASGEGEGEGVLRVRLGREVLRPGERVGLDVEVLAEARDYTVSATFETPGGTEVLGLDSEANGAGRWRGTLVCRGRGRHVLTVQAWRGGATVETWQRVLEVASREGEGTRLELDEPGLRQLAARGAGEYLGEADRELAQRIAARLQPKTRVEKVSVVSSGPWYLLAVVALMAVEWTVRRRSNLV